MMARVYPRACGGTSSCRSALSPRMGLSPRVRGNLAPASQCDPSSGSITARVGEPLPRRDWGVSIGVYPRACGGTMPLARSALNSWGLSPRVRGNRLALLALAVRVGFIPARAGEPRCPARHRRRCRGSIPARAGEPGTVVPANTVWRVYPRACGGTSTSLSCTSRGAGLSPRVRGNPRRVNKKHLLNGSVPARAGEPTAILAITSPNRVYPRACGGTPGQRHGTADEYGLSPRVRGNLTGVHTVGRILGSIPARAGEPYRRRPGSPSGRVYPRACGGTVHICQSETFSGGLSPRVRGNLYRAPADRHGLGSIPARAGEPSGNGFWLAGIGVYPRACGGTFTHDIAMWELEGLSPRVRGNLDLHQCRMHLQGSIPARAGEPFSKIGPRSMPWVYPRACGGTEQMSVGTRAFQGLSPRVRGNRVATASSSAS